MVQLGYQVTLFDSTWPALDFIRSARPAVLLSDVVMPGGLDGLGLASLVLADLPDTRVVITTGFRTGIVGYRNGQVPGIGPVLQKPFGKTELTHAIQQPRLPKEDHAGTAVQASASI